MISNFYNPSRYASLLHTKYTFVSIKKDLDKNTIKKIPKESIIQMKKLREEKPYMFTTSDLVWSHPFEKDKIGSYAYEVDDIGNYYFHFDIHDEIRKYFLKDFNLEKVEILSCITDDVNSFHRSIKKYLIKEKKIEKLTRCYHEVNYFQLPRQINLLFTDPDYIENEDNSLKTKCSHNNFIKPTDLHPQRMNLLFTDPDYIKNEENELKTIWSHTDFIELSDLQPRNLNYWRERSKIPFKSMKKKKYKGIYNVS